ncbi:unnamed protein product [Calicophoron daubneyi]|uniref:Transmembrane protein 185A n=1 Tax=Calicophoron daubneyi TaxID=300641 RepID=A0AAV2TRP3_CALDB
MTLQEKLENVNEGTVFVCFCLFWWIFLVGARADNLLIIPYWVVFLPLWIWKCTVLIGWLTGLIVWLRQRRRATPESGLSAYEDPALPYIQAMSVSTFFSLFLACSEILLCLELSIPSLQLAYLTILTPFLLVGLLGIFAFFFVMIDSRSVMPWTRRHRGGRRIRSRFHGNENGELYDPSSIAVRPRRVCTFTLELCIAANLLQLLFLVARLDNWIRSKWIVTFIPTFILLGMGFLFCTVGFIVALIRYFTAYFIPAEQRRLPIYYYTSHIFMGFLLCTAVALLALRLDGHLSSAQMSYSLICTPVLLSLVIYMISAFCFGPGNPWWFGLNRNISLAIFEACPALQLCANTSVSAAGLFKPSANNRAASANSSGLNRATNVESNQPANASDPASALDSHLRNEVYSPPSADSHGIILPPAVAEYGNDGGRLTPPSSTETMSDQQPESSGIRSNSSEDPTQPLLEGGVHSAVSAASRQHQKQSAENVRCPD